MVLLLSSAGCFNRATFEGDFQNAPLAQNPFVAGPEHAQAPPTASTRQGDSFRITLADSKEVCVSGQTSDDAARVRVATFVLESYNSPDEQGKVASVKSKRVKIIQDTERSTNRGVVEPVTVFEACFDNKHVFTAETAYLTLQPEAQHVANKLFVAWHFTKDPVVREKHALDLPQLLPGRDEVRMHSSVPRRPRELERFEEHGGSAN
ncbi:hypothetical protein [Pendulispora albinea]|uniref:Lipoprotein n=1 Tax=Pendulispora albinea TaxID=2741071 RepID=A0ABZ2M9T5_9BACT